MEPIPIPPEALAGRPDCREVKMGPPSGVSDDDCGTAAMLVSSTRHDLIPGFPCRRLAAYFRPSPEELATLQAGGFIEVCQYGQVVQPFSAAVWSADSGSVRS